VSRPSAFAALTVGNTRPPLEVAGRLCQAVAMAKKRSKSDRSQRQADQREKKTDRTPEQTPKKQPRETIVPSENVTTL